MNHDNLSSSKLDSELLMQELLQDYLKDKKKKRSWRRFSFLLLFFLLAFFVFTFFSDAEVIPKPHVGLINIDGEISESKIANADEVALGLDEAYKSKDLKALILRINSPGGSPVQAEYIYNTMNFYKKKYPKIKTYAVCVDLCASAAYYIATAADEIYASPASMVGSIGVIYNGFGFVDAIEKLGITRRLQTAGAHKAFLDPFLLESPEAKGKLQEMLDLIHKQFIARVKTGRGARLKIDDETFSGLFWIGEQAYARGLIDGFASAGQLARDVIQVDLIIDYTHKQNIFDKMTENLGMAVADRLPSSLGLKPEFR